MATNRVQVTVYLRPENYQQLQEYMAEQGLSETIAIDTIVSSYFANKSEDELVARIARIERGLSELKRYLIAIRFR